MRKSSYLSQLLYFWAEPFVWQGYKNPLTLSDLWDLDSNLTSNELVPKFDDALNPLIEKAKSSKLMCGSCHIRNVLIGANIKIVVELWMFIYFLLFGWGKFNQN